MTKRLLAIPWSTSLEEGQEKAAGRGVPVLLYFSAAPECLGSLGLEVSTFEDARVGEFVNERLVPVRLAARAHRDLMAQFAVAWTPALLLTDENGVVHFRIDGFLPATELLAHLALGIGHFELCQGRPILAAERFSAVIAHHGGTEMAAEAAWWLAIAHFRQSQDSARLRAEWAELARAHPRSAWAARTRLPAAAGGDA